MRYLLNTILALAICCAPNLASAISLEDVNEIIKGLFTGSGVIKIETDAPEAIIYVDGKKSGMIGSDGQARIEVLEGSHVIRIEKYSEDGFWMQESSKEVYISADSVTAFNLPTKTHETELYKAHVKEKTRKEQLRVNKKIKFKAERIEYVSIYEDENKQFIMLEKSYRALFDVYALSIDSLLKNVQKLLRQRQLDQNNILATKLKNGKVYIYYDTGNRDKILYDDIVKFD